MTLFERIKVLAKKRDKSMKEVATDIGFSENLFYRWKTTEPKGVDLQKVADYFDVSVDYLLGRTDDPSPPNSEKNHSESDPLEKDLLMAFRSQSDDMTPEEKEKFNESLKGMMKIARGLLDDDSNWKE